MSLAVFPSAPSFSTAETDDTAMLDDAQVPPAGDMEMSPRREPMQSFTATASMEWGAPSQPQLAMGDLSMATDAALDTSMYAEAGPVDMEMTAEYDMTMDDDVIHQNYEMHMADAALIAPISVQSAVPLADGHEYAARAVEAAYAVPTPAVAVDPGLAAPVLAPLHAITTEAAQFPLHSPHDAVNPAAAAIPEFYAPIVAPAGPESGVASEPAPPAANPPHEEPIAAFADPSAPPESETTVEHAVEVVAPVQPADEQYYTADPAQEPEPDTAHVTEVVSQSEEYRQVEQEALPAEPVRPQEETYEENATSEPYTLEPPTLGIPPILLSIPFSPTSSPAHSPHLPVVQSLYSLFSLPDLSTLPSSSSQLRPPDVHLLLADRPQLFFENVATLLQALRGELLGSEGGGVRKDMFEFMEMILYARQLDLTLPEDNIHAQSISLYDFAALHQSCAVPGYLHLDLKLQVRFKSRWDEIKRAVSEQEREYDAEGYTEHEQAAPRDERQEGLTQQAPSTTVHEEQAQDGTTTRAEDSNQPELPESAPTIPHQSQQQQQTTDDQPSFDLSEFVGFEEPPLNDDDDNWDDDDDGTARVANTTADTFTSLAHTEVPAQNNGGAEQYTDSHQFPEGEGVNTEYGEYGEGEWGIEEGHEGDGAPVEQAEAPTAGQVVGQVQAAIIEAGDEVAQYDGEEYIGPEYEYVYNESEDVEGEGGEWAGADAEAHQLNAVTEPEPEVVVDYSQDVSTQQDYVPLQTTQDSAATATTISLHHLPAPPLPQQQEHVQPEGETREPEEYYNAGDADAQEYYRNYDEGDAEEGDGSLEHPIDLTAVDGGDDQPADEQQVHGDPNTYTGGQDVDEVSTLEGSESQDGQPALPEAEAGGELVNDESAGAGPMLVNVQTGVTVQRRASGHKRRHEDVEAEENEEDFGYEVKRARLG